MRRKSLQRKQIWTKGEFNVLNGTMGHFPEGKSNRQCSVGKDRGQGSGSVPGETQGSATYQPHDLKQIIKLDPKLLCLYKQRQQHPCPWVGVKTLYSVSSKPSQLAPKPAAPSSCPPAW